MTHGGTAAWVEAWQPMAAAVGRDFAANEDQVYGAAAIERGAILRYLEPLEFGCALHNDPAVARAHGHPDVIAPHTALLTFSIPAMWRPGESPIFTSEARDAEPARSPMTGRFTGLEPPTTGYFATDFAMDWNRPAAVGERLCRRGALLLSCEPKETAVGRGAFITWQSEIANEAGEVLALMRIGTFRYVPNPAPAAAQPRQARGEAPPAAQAPPPAPARTNPAWQDFRVGDAIPPVRFPLSVYRLVVAAGANRDFNAIHHNTDYARATGAPEMYANTMFLQGMWERTLREAIGDAGLIRSLSGFRMRRFNTVGDTVTVRGRVAETWREGPLGLVAFEMWSENRGGVSVGPGRMVASVPVG